jgi:YfiH family protein
VRQGGAVLCHQESLPGARVVFTDRAGGVSDPPYDALNLARHTGDDPRRVTANREALARAVGLPAAALVFGQQVHGNGVRLVSRPSARANDAGLPQTDGLVTTTPGLALVMMGADCPPVLLDADGVVGAAHVGRPGLAAGVLPEVLRVMRENGAGPVTAWIGPRVCGGCYEVPEAMAAEVEALAPGSRATTRQGTPSIDLAAGIRGQLSAAGVTDVVDVGGCTLEQPARFFSYRRDGVTGRHAGLVFLT